MKNDNDLVELEIRQSEAIDAVLSTDQAVEMGDGEEVLLHHPENIEFLAYCVAVGKILKYSISF